MSPGQNDQLVVRWQVPMESTEKRSMSSFSSRARGNLPPYPQLVTIATASALSLRRVKGMRSGE